MGFNSGFKGLNFLHVAMWSASHTVARTVSITDVGVFLLEHS